MRLLELADLMEHAGYADGDSGYFYRDFTYEEWADIRDAIRENASLRQREADLRRDMDAMIEGSLVAERMHNSNVREIQDLAEQVAALAEELRGIACNAYGTMLDGGSDAYEVCKDINASALAVLKDVESASSSLLSRVRQQALQDAEREVERGISHTMSFEACDCAGCRIRAMGGAEAGSGTAHTPPRPVVGSEPDDASSPSQASDGPAKGDG